MAEDIRVVPTSFGTSDWRVESGDKTYLCDIRLEISLTLNASRYYILRSGKLVREGTFNFRAWNDDATQELLIALVKSMYPHSKVTVELPTPLGQAVGH
jgi:hypothetical protein